MNMKIKPLDWQLYINNNATDHITGEIAYVEDTHGNILFYYLVFNPFDSHDQYDVMIAGKMHRIKFNSNEDAKNYCDLHNTRFFKKYLINEA